MQWLVISFIALGILLINLICLLRGFKGSCELGASVFRFSDPMRDRRMAQSALLEICFIRHKKIISYIAHV